MAAKILDDGQNGWQIKRGGILYVTPTLEYIIYVKKLK